MGVQIDMFGAPPPPAEEAGSGARARVPPVGEKLRRRRAQADEDARQAQAAQAARLARVMREGYGA